MEACFSVIRRHHVLLNVLVVLMLTVGLCCDGLRSSREAIITVICRVAQSLEGSIVDTAVGPLGPAGSM